MNHIKQVERQTTIWIMGGLKEIKEILGVRVNLCRSGVRFGVGFLFIHLALLSFIRNLSIVLFFVECGHAVDQVMD